MRRIILLISLLITACSTPASQTATPASSPVPYTQTSILPAPTPTTPAAIPDREKYTLNTDIDYDLHTVSADETIVYPNHSGQPLDSLTLAVAANLWGDCFHLNEIRVNGVWVRDYVLNLNRLDIPLPTPLAADSVTTLNLHYSLSLPFMDQQHSSRARIFGYSQIQMNLVNWYPFIVPFKNGEWMIREPWSQGEYLLYPIADFEVNLKFADPQTAPVVAASGVAEPEGDSTRYTLTDGRAFAISASRDFQVSSLKSGDTTVYSYYLPIYKDAGLAAMVTSAEALQVYLQKFGPYPHKTLSVVMADFHDSMEFSAFYFHSRSFYDLYDGSPTSYLVAVAAHETGHQWWFEQVASDQADEPWLDEALTTYTESIFYESVYPDTLPWWWSARIDFFNPHGKINISVYEGQDPDTYKDIVYFNGAHFFQDLRKRIGDDAFFAFLQDYLAQEKDKIAARDDFFRILNQHTNVDYSDLITLYFK